MTKRDKLLTRFLSRTVDFTWEELVTLMGHFGFVYRNDGGGSHGEFYNEELNLLIKPATRPHGGKSVIKRYQMKQYKESLIAYGLIDPEEDR